MQSCLKREKFVSQERIYHVIKIVTEGKKNLALYNFVLYGFIAILVCYTSSNKQSSVSRFFQKYFNNVA